MNSGDPSRRDLMGLLAVIPPVAGGLVTGANIGDPAGRRQLALSGFSGADPTGVNDSSSAIKEAIATAQKARHPLLIDGLYRYTTPLTVPARILLIGNGATSDAAARGASCLLKDFDTADAGIAFVGGDGGAMRVHFDNVPGRDGDNVQMAGERQTMEFCAFTNAGRDGLRIGREPPVNANLWRLVGVMCLNNRRHGLHIASPATSPDANGGLLLGADLRGNGGDGLCHGDGLWNTFINACCQDNHGAGFRLAARACGCTVLGGDLEGNRAAQGIIESGAIANKIDAPLYHTGSWHDQSPQGANRIITHDAETGGFVDYDILTVANPRPGGEAVIRLIADTGLDQVAQIRAKKLAGTSGGIGLWTKADGNALIEAVFFDEKQNAHFRAGCVEKYLVLPYQSRMAVEPKKCRRARVSVSDGKPWMISIEKKGAVAGQVLSITIRNTADAEIALGTWAMAKLSAPVRPGPGKAITVHFFFDGQSFVEEGRSAEVPL